MKHTKHLLIASLIVFAVSIALYSEPSASQPVSNTTSGEVLSNIFDWEKTLNQGTQDGVGDYLAENWMLHDLQMENRYGIDGYRDWVNWYHAMMPDDFRFIAEGRETVDNLAVVVWTIFGTHSGDVAGIPASGNTIILQGVLFHRFENGKLVEAWIHYNRQEFLVQVGLEESLEPCGGLLPGGRSCE